MDPPFLSSDGPVKRSTFGLTKFTKESKGYSGLLIKVLDSINFMVVLNPTESFGNDTQLLYVCFDSLNS